MSADAQISCHDFAYGPRHDRHVTQLYNSQSKTAWSLRQKPCETQTLISIFSAIEPSYIIKIIQSLQYSKSRSAMMVQKEINGERMVIAKATFNSHLWSCMISYKGKNVAQMVMFEHSPNPRYTCKIKDSAQYWQALGPSQTVLELVDERARRIALFVRTSDAVQQADHATGHKVQSTSDELGTLHIMESLNQSLAVIEQIICSAVVVLEMSKMKSAKARP